MPTNNQNRSKVKYINKITEGTDVLAITESGSTKKDITWSCNDNFEIVRENKA